MSNKTIDKASKEINRFNASLLKQGDIKRNGKAVTKLTPVQQVRAWLCVNKQSLKTCTQIERVLQAFEKEAVSLEYMKEEVNRFLNRKFFTE